MRFRTKLFIIWSATVLLPLAAVMLPLQWTLRSSFEHVASAGFAGTGQSLASLQAERVSRMRQAAVLVMSIPELRALIAEHSYELTSENLTSLQERLDSLRELVNVSFICVMDGEGTLIAQNHNSPWPTLPQFREFAKGSSQAKAMIRRLFGANARTRHEKGEQGLWVYRGRIYQVVGMPLVFGAVEAEHPPQIDGALLMAVPLSDEVAARLGKSHDCQITFLAEGKALSSSLPPAQRANLTAVFGKENRPASAAFNLTLDGETYRSLLEPLTDDCSAIMVGQMLIQSSSSEAEIAQQNVRHSLAIIMLLALLAALTTSFLLSGAVTKPVRELVDAAKSVAGGDLTVALRVQRRDELGALAIGFNDMIDGLRRQRELKAMVEESQAASKAKSQFLANMSHEIRTPLHGVIGMAELLLRMDLSDQQRRYVGLIKSSGEVLTTLINDILDFSKIEAGKLELETIEFNLTSLIEDVIELMGQRAVAKGLRITSVIDPDVHSMMRGDPTRLRQILLNLISNAMKFTEAGGVTVRAMRQVADGVAITRLEVADTGIGIPPDRVDRLFKSFSQVDASTTRRYGGTGLGLAISKQLVELMNGRIGVESVAGKGSTFWFTVKLQEAPSEPGCPLIAVPVHDAPGLGHPGLERPLRILLAEDQEINQIVATELLREAGYAFDVVSDGGNAVEAVKRNAYDLVLMDCQMPVMDGFEAARAIRQFERDLGGPSSRRVPIIALTANAGGGDRERCLAAGMDGHCGKPFSSRQLLDAIAAAVSHGVVDDIPTADCLPAIPSDDTCGHAVGGTVQLPPFDPDAVLRRCSGKALLAAIVLEKFEKQANDAVARLGKAVAAHDAEELARLSHAIKGSAGLVAAEGLRSVAARMEEMGRNHSLDSADECLEQLRGEVLRCSQYIARTKEAAPDVVAPGLRPAFPDSNASGGCPAPRAKALI
jgi:signal transduction histidine kinase/HPt (histidine-containing phosphotransfer) domain-containing protein